MSCADRTSKSVTSFFVPQTRIVRSGWATRVYQFAARVRRQLERHRTRRQLLDLDDHLLDDIGLTREQAEEAGRRPFWR